MGYYSKLKDKFFSHVSRKQLISAVIGGLIVFIITVPFTSPYARHLIAGVYVTGELPDIDFIGSEPYIKPVWAEQPQTEYEPELKISNSKIIGDREIYSPGDNITIYFRVWNTKELPYNVSVDWLNGNTRHKGWQTRSTKIYNTTNASNPYSSWYKPTKKGEWRVQILIEYLEDGEKHTETVVKSFEVV
ncbi:hypothetical protein GKQ38_00880 [Candidatus Nanohaloarchaea archaeon]|nr:hypothetical protein GKQ38_00880 [Candidatus Nanohaloarchaea archaeon]